MKRIAAIVSTGVTLGLAAKNAFAQSPSTPLCPPGAGFDSLCNLKPSNAGGAVGTVVAVLLIIGIIMSLIYLVWGAVRWIMSGGDKGKIDAARSAVVAAVVGLVISLLAYFILNFLLVFFTGSGASGMQIPTLLQ